VNVGGIPKGVRDVPGKIGKRNLGHGDRHFRGKEKKRGGIKKVEKTLGKPKNVWERRTVQNARQGGGKQ